MASDSPDLVPMTDAHPEFDPALRGYDRTQVDEYIASLDEEIRALQADRDLAAARSADLAAHLAATQAQMESLRRQLNMATEQVTPSNVDARVAEQLRAAQNDAATLREMAHREADFVRRGAAEYAARTRAAAEEDAARIVEEATARQREAEELFRRRMAETEQHKEAVAQQLAERLAYTQDEQQRLTADAAELRARLDAEAEAERNRLNAEAAAERNRLDAEAAAKRKEVEEDFVITLSRRRSKATQELEDERAAAEAEAGRIVADARAEAERLVAQAVAEVRRLHGDRDQAFDQLRALQAHLGKALEIPRSATPAEPGAAQ
jgi:cell division septum initiation protein DivIVA